MWQANAAVRRGEELNSPNTRIRATPLTLKDEFQPRHNTIPIREDTHYNIIVIGCSM